MTRYLCDFCKEEIFKDLSISFHEQRQGYKKDIDEHYHLCPDCYHFVYNKVQEIREQCLNNIDSSKLGRKYVDCEDM